MTIKNNLVKIKDNFSTSNDAWFIINDPQQINEKENIKHLKVLYLIDVLFSFIVFSYSINSYFVGEAFL